MEINIGNWIPISVFSVAICRYYSMWDRKTSWRSISWCKTLESRYTSTIIHFILRDHSYLDIVSKGPLTHRLSHLISIFFSWLLHYKPTTGSFKFCQMTIKQVLALYDKFGMISDMSLTKGWQSFFYPDVHIRLLTIINIAVHPNNIAPITLHWHIPCIPKQ